MPLFSSPVDAQSDSPWLAVLDTGQCEMDLLPLPSSKDAKDDRQIRRRSSKGEPIPHTKENNSWQIPKSRSKLPTGMKGRLVMGPDTCDQCRKSKCKCERHGAVDEPCKNCVLLGTPCTFLGPSRKRGPPKGYIDAIESRLHQMEALFGVLLSSSDPRAHTLLQDLAGDPLAHEILQRIDESPFGTHPMPQAGTTVEAHVAGTTRTSARQTPGRHVSGLSNQWQDHLKERLRAGANRHLRSALDDPSNLPSTVLHRDPADESPRQRLRLHSPDRNSHSSPSHSSLSPVSEDDPEDEEDLTSAVGQLSLNEESQVRYHGKVSGLHILGQSDRLDQRNEGGIWRFPKAGVWPRASHTADHSSLDLASAEQDARAHFPTPDVQRELLELYFAYVHPVLPLMHKAQFWSDFRQKDKKTPRVPTLLLTCMFAIAARYRTTPDVPLPPADGDMWNAGDDFLEHAKRILNQTYASSRPPTCQALLLLSYRQIGIGAMAQAWLYVGMAVRMAQDLGMHRSAEKWFSQRTGAQIFTESERQVRKRIWFACVIMDKYVSTYIGRPLSIFERDCDAPYPAEEEEEEAELWQEYRSGCSGENAVRSSTYTPVAARIASCFNASARLSSILSNIVETIYGVQPSPPHTRHADAALLEQQLDRWYLELPSHLQLGTAVPPPHVFTLHMQYWCAVLLLHRPFMRRKPDAIVQDREVDAETTASYRRAFDLCAMAATKISNTISKFKENFDLQRSPAFLTYYVFSASIMHISTLSIRPIDIQAGLGLQRCMDCLKMMQVVWPSAGRAWDLLHGAKIDMREIERSRQAQAHGTHEKRKREQVEVSAEDSALVMMHTDESFAPFLQQPPLSFADTTLFERWSSQDALNYASSPNLSALQDNIEDASRTTFGDISGSPPMADIWTEFPEQFSDPALLASSLYSLPVMSPGPGVGIQGQGQGPSGLPLSSQFMGGGFFICNGASSGLFGPR